MSETCLAARGHVISEHPYGGALTSEAILRHFRLLQLDPAQQAAVAELADALG